MASVKYPTIKELQDKIALDKILCDERKISDESYAEMQFQKNVLAAVKWLAVLIGGGLGAAWLKLIIK